MKYRIKDPEIKKRIVELCKTEQIAQMRIQECAKEYFEGHPETPSVVIFIRNRHLSDKKKFGFMVLRKSDFEVIEQQEDEE